MNFLRFLLFSLILIPSAVFAQTQEKTKAIKFFEFGKISDKLLKEKVEALRVEIVNVRSNKDAGYIVHYRTPREAALLNSKIGRSLPRNCGYDMQLCGSLRFIHIASSKKRKTVFWIVPEGVDDTTILEEKLDQK